jgi:hypothetical protein
MMIKLCRSCRTQMHQTQAGSLLHGPRWFWRCLNPRCGQFHSEEPDGTLIPFQ